LCGNGESLPVSPGSLDTWALYPYPGVYDIIPAAGESLSTKAVVLSEV
jgi:hypothetical protein